MGSAHAPLLPVHQVKARQSAFAQYSAKVMVVHLFDNRGAPVLELELLQLSLLHLLLKGDLGMVEQAAHWRNCTSCSMHLLPLSCPYTGCAHAE